MSTAVKGRFTFRFAAVCFGLSAVFELFNLRDAALLFGHAVGGAGAAIYHVAYAALFTWLTIGLWNASRSGYSVLLVTSLIYTADRLQSLFVGDSLATSLRQQVEQHPEVLQIFSVEDLVRVVNLTTWVMLAGWWSFVAYAYFRRDYFGIRPASN